MGANRFSGRLTWTGANYVGVLRRESKYTECGVHGAGTCVVSVTGSGDVQVSGQVNNDEGTPNLYLRWSPARDTEIAVEGNCTAAYRTALARMYSTVTHADTDPAAEGGRWRGGAGARGPTVEGAGLAIGEWLGRAAATA